MNKLSKLRKLFKEHYIDGYLIPKNDEFFGEYTSDHNDRLKYITNKPDEYYMYCRRSWWIYTMYKS